MRSNSVVVTVSGTVQRPEGEVQRDGEAGEGDGEVEIVAHL